MFELLLWLSPVPASQIRWLINPMGWSLLKETGWNRLSVEIKL